MVLYICEKFHNNILKSFQLTEQIPVHGRNGYLQCSKGNNSKSRQTRIMVYVFCMLSHSVLHTFYVKFRENISDGIRVMEWTQMMEALTD